MHTPDHCCSGTDRRPAELEVVHLDARYARHLLITVLSTLIVASSALTIVAASLPTMAASLHTTEGLLSWGVTGPFLMVAVGTPVLGRLGDVHGHREIFLIGAAVLATGTALCAVAPTAGGFVAARMVVGIGIAATFPTSITLVMAAYSVARRSEAMGWFQMTLTGAPVIGLIVGGPMIEAFGWRSPFFALLPISIGALFVGARVIRPSVRGVPTAVDWGGAASLATATLGLLLYLERAGATRFADPLALSFAAAGVIGLVSFVAVERRVPHPMLRLAYLRRPNFRGPLIAEPLCQFAFMGSFLIAPLLLAVLFDMSVAAVAFVMLARPAAYSLTSPVGGRLTRAIGERRMILTGTMLLTTSMAVWSIAAFQVNLLLVLVALVLSGVAMGIAQPSFPTTIAGAVDPGDIGTANGVGKTMMSIGMLTGIQAMFTVLGDGRAPEDFARVFAVGGGVAALGVVGGLMVTSSPRPARGRDVDGLPVSG